MGRGAPGFKIPDLKSQLQSVAAPGAAFQRSGNVKNAYLQVGTVISDTTGFPVRLNNAELTFIAVTNSDISTFEVEIYQWDGLLELLLATVTITADYGSDYTPPSPIPVTYGTELRAKVNNTGQAKNPVVIAFTTGEVPGV